MVVATALYASGAVLLVIAGAVKLARPASTAALIDDLGMAPGSLDRDRLARALGVGEVALGLTALVGEIAAIAVVVGVTYVAFAATVVQAKRVGAGSCGCFGRIDAPPSWWHVGGNLGLAVSSFAAAAGRSPLEVMEDQPLGGVGFVVIIGVLAGLELLVFTSLPEALTSRQRA